MNVRSRNIAVRYGKNSLGWRLVSSDVSESTAPWINRIPAFTLFEYRFI